MSVSVGHGNARSSQANIRGFFRGPKEELYLLGFPLGAPPLPRSAEICVLPLLVAGSAKTSPRTAKCQMPSVRRSLVAIGRSGVLPRRELIIQRGDLVQPIDDLFVGRCGCVATCPIRLLPKERGVRRNCGVREDPLHVDLTFARHVAIHLTACDCVSAGGGLQIHADRARTAERQAIRHGEVRKNAPEEAFRAGFRPE
jgi:hypothetical protein